MNKIIFIILLCLSHNIFAEMPNQFLSWKNIGNQNSRFVVNNQNPWTDTNTYGLFIDTTNSAGNPIDSSTNGIVISNNGTIPYLLGLNPWGRSESAIDFRGNSPAPASATQFSVVTNIPYFGSTQPFSVFFWIYRPSAANSTGFIASKRTTQEWHIGIWNQILYCGIISSIGLGATLETYGNVIPTNTWIFATIVYDGGSSASSLNIYTNGVLNIGTNIKTGSFTSRYISTGPIYVGCYDSIKGNPFIGMLDTFGYVNRAMTTNEMKILYQNTGGVSGPQYNIRARP